MKVFLRVQNLSEKIQAENLAADKLIRLAYKLARQLRNTDNLSTSMRRLRTAELLKELQDLDPALYEQQVNKVEPL